MRDIDHDFTDEIVCPYCGDRKSDSWKWVQGDGNEQCSSCKMNYFYFRHVIVKYSTSKASCLNGEPHKLSDWIEPVKGIFYRYCKDCGKSERK